MPSADSCRLITLNVSVRGSSAPTRTNDGHCLGPRSGCSARNALNFVGVELRALGEHQRRHHLIADIGAGIPYTATSITSGWRSSTRSIGAEPRFSPSTRIQSPSLPAKYA